MALALVLLYGSMLWYYYPRASAQKKPFTNIPVSVSVLVPARNESASLADCLQTLVEQDFPADRYEVIVIDDHSTDNTLAVARAFAQNHPRIRCLSLADYLSGQACKAYKKAALSYGIQQAKGDFILSTDADCTMPVGWIKSMLNPNADFVLGPVRIPQVNSLLSAFQALDICGVMQLTHGSALRGQALLANGANLGFRKKLFQEIDGYAGVDHLASGDDVLLLQKVRLHKTALIHFVDQPEAVVCTEPESTWLGLWRQRLRWAGKTGAYTDPRLLAVQIISFLLCWAVLLSVPLYFLPFGMSPWTIVALWLGKMSIDFFWLRRACQHFGEGQWMQWFLPCFVLHTWYVAIIGLLALLPIPQNWKGRVLRSQQKIAF